jgi:putative phosphoesterase
VIDRPARPTADGPLLVGIVSDTHGSISEHVLDALAGADHIVHAGDIGGPDVLWILTTLAPVTATLGNMDSQIPGWDLPPVARVTLGGVRLVVIHDVRMLGETDDADVVVHGHTHTPENVSRNGVVFFNPGSAREPTGASVPPSVGLLELHEGRVLAARHVMLDGG